MNNIKQDVVERTISILKKLTNNEFEERYEKMSQDVLDIIYSIGGDYGEKTIEAVAKTYIENNMI